MTIIPEKIIGIVGGVGPLAGLDLAAKIVANTNAAGDRGHVPFILASIPEIINDRTAYLLDRSQANPAEGMTAVLEKLKAAGATVVGVPCNTAHAAPIFGPFKQQAEKMGLAVVNMLAETSAYLAEASESGPVAVLSTLGTWESGVYADYLQAAGVGQVDLGRAVMERVHRVIYDSENGIKSRADGDFTWARRELEEVLSVCEEKGATTVVLGCTELPLVLPEKKLNGLNLVDPTAILARALIEAVAPEKLTALPTK